MHPAIVSDGAVRTIKNRENQYGLHAIAGQNFSKNASVRLTKGPFADFQAIFKEKRSGNRVLILLDILGSASQVEVSQETLAPA